MTSSPWPPRRSALDPDQAPPRLAGVPDAGSPLRIGPYCLLAMIGEGGMGVVHLARHDDGRRVALKVLRPQVVGDDEARQRLAREVSSLRRVRSRRVAEVLDADPWGPVPYVATRYVPGLSLHDHVLEQGAITGPDLAWLAAGLAEGLADVHQVGVLHRDIKPANVLMEGRSPILIDFGLARVADDSRLTHAGWLIGTPGYLAPEILYGEDATAASDVHSWAATVAWAATGQAPFGRGPSMAIMDRVRRGEHDLGGAPVGLRALLAAALEPEPGDRPDLDEVREHLAGLGPDLGRSQPVPLRWSAAPTDVLAVAPPMSAGGADPTLAISTYPPLRAAPPAVPVPLGLAAQPAIDPGTDPGAQRTGILERLRRVTLLGAVVLDIALVVALVPWLSLAALLIVAWLLRGASLGASALADRRRLRGRRFYDAPLALVRAPWHLLRSVPGALLQSAWSLALAAVTALLCLRGATTLVTALIAVGATLAVALWTGPGALRVRAPVRRVLRPAARTTRAWLTSLALGLGAAVLLALLLAQHGPTWTPATGQPPGAGAFAPRR